MRHGEASAGGRRASRLGLTSGGGILVLCLLCLAASTLAGCGGRAAARARAEQSGFVPQRFSSEDYVLLGWLRPERRPGGTDKPLTGGGTLHVYIEGDGRAWIFRDVPSSDPTPSSPVALDLAAADPTPDPVLYLGRPCQYVVGEDRRGCTEEDWTAGRFSPRVLAAVNAAVDTGLARTGAATVALYGFSGGGAVAALLAERRADVVFLATVASNLDHAAWTRHHGVSPLSGSLNPMDGVSRTARIPQLHVSGEKDDVVPSFIADAWCAALPGAVCLRRTVAGATHQGPWVPFWPDLLLRGRPPLP